MVHRRALRLSGGKGAACIQLVGDCGRVTVQIPRASALHGTLFNATVDFRTHRGAPPCTRLLWAYARRNPALAEYARCLVAPGYPGEARAAAATLLIEALRATVPAPF